MSKGRVIDFGARRPPVGRGAKNADDRKNGNGGDGGMSDLERRVGNLEADMKAVRADLSGLKSDMAAMNAKMDAAFPTFATKSDLAELKAELKGDISKLALATNSDIAELRTELKGDIAELKTEFKGLETAMHKEFSAQTKWMVGTILAAVVAMAGIQRLFPPKAEDIQAQARVADDPAVLAARSWPA